jgi:L-threonylcarbamoyladenylate synthase
MPDCRNNASAADSESIAAAASALRAGGIVVYPTETVYGLGADALNPAALQRLATLKVRPSGKPIAVLIADRLMLEDVVSEVPAEAEILMRRFWPGPLTIVLPARTEVSRLLTGDGRGIGVRCSSHPLAAALVRALGRPLTTPSANPAGERPPTQIAEAQGYFGTQVDFYLDGGTLAGEPASTVVDVRNGLQVIREGAIAAETVRASLRAR